MLLAFKAFFDCIASGFNWSKTRTEKQTETYTVKDAKKLQKAVDIAENIILLTMRYRFRMTEKDRERLEKLVEKFKKYN